MIFDAIAWVVRKAILVALVLFGLAIIPGTIFVIAYVIEQVVFDPNAPRLASACEVSHTCDEREIDERDPAYISPF